MQRLLVSAVAVGVLAVGLAACGSSAKSSTPAPAPSPTTAAGGSVTTSPSRPAAGPTITINSGPNGFAFATLPVKAGATVTVKNLTSAQHTVTADTTAGGFDLAIDPGKTATFTAPSKPGAYGFHCNIHTYMMGTLTVT
jgi:plastocyanin